uniref:Optic atrophy 3 n=1 Tax=Aceria tosichella TaxID=561515 RepID=A0A6G1S9R9_9ACAR
MAAFPLLKLGVMAIRQISKPFANHLKTRAKESHFFRTRICMPPAQFYHWCEVNIKARLLNLSSPKEVVKLNEQAAIDLGSELIGDLFMFSIGAAAVIAEYTRQSRKSAEEKAVLEARLSQIENNTNSLVVLRSDLETRIAQIETSLDDLKKLVTPEKKKK